MTKFYFFALALLAAATVSGQYATAGQSPFSASGSDVLFTSSIGGTQRGVITVTNSGQKTFRLVTRNASGTRIEVGPSGCSGNLDIGTLDGSVINGVQPCTTGSFRTNGSQRTYVFKTPQANQSGQFIFWRLTDAVREINNVTSTVSDGVSPPNTSVSITATLGAGQTIKNRQNMYIRYSDDGFASSFIVAMTDNDDGTFTGNIPGEGLTEGETVSYYLLSSATSNANPITSAVTAANADLRTITFNNNGGANYSFAVTSSAPVTYASFNGKRTSGGVRLDWSTASEVDAAFFAVERSSTREPAWETVGRVTALNEVDGADYTFLDTDAPPEQLRYRLRQVDFDGAVHYSTILTVREGQIQPPLEIWPQPATAGAVRIRAAGREGEVGSLYSNTGQLITTFRISGRTQYLPTVSLAAGLYLLHIGGEQPVTRRLLID
ncbi:T9SS type A sorting domain-containing protein [Lewinella sp. JB7]|uniref:T9SS type A sorting domain-containing protein n=1 Tax=Lewinella sp. JB7 TaxID=2962887 RepID=UPI0020CA0EFA|nr:T9SS type A sorting domain-containing protein [Lewinella sp. JB7]MCP9236458.1 T9SS type A sorting domain-containing protein [Lewinella sp. JB7]